MAIARGDDIDVIEIDAASNTGVDNVRELIENAHYRPARSRFKVYIIDEVHMLSKSGVQRAAQDAGRAAEPCEIHPGHDRAGESAADDSVALPAVRFPQHPHARDRGHLNEICKQEKIKADEDALLLVAKAGAGRCAIRCRCWIGC